MSDKNEMFRFKIVVDNVYTYIFNKFVSTFFSEKKEVSGWVKENEIPELKEMFLGKQITLIPETEYWANWDSYK